MIEIPMRLLIFWTAVMGLLRPSFFRAEPLPPRALARIGDHRFYHGPGITCIALSPDGRTAASYGWYADLNGDIADEDGAAYDPVLVLWDAVTGERLREIRVCLGIDPRLAFSADGKRLAVSYDNSNEKCGVALYDVETGTPLLHWSNFRAQISCLQFSADGKQLHVSEWHGRVSAWDVESGKQLHLWHPPPVKVTSESTAVKGVLSPDGKLIVWEMRDYIRGDRTSYWMEDLRIHDAETNKLLYQKKFLDRKQASDHNEFMWPIAFTSDSERLIADCTDKLVVWEAATGRELATLQVEEMVRFAVSPDGSRAVIEEAEKHERKTRLRLWDIETGKPLREFFSFCEDLGNGYRGALAVFSADGRTLLIATNEVLRFFDAETGKERTNPRHRGPITPQFSADGRTLFTTCAEQRCRWNVSTDQPTLLSRVKTGKQSGEIEKVVPPGDRVVSPNGRLVVWVEEAGNIRLQDSAAKKPVRILRSSPPLLKGGAAYFLTHLLFSPDGERLIVAGEFMDALGSDVGRLPLRVFHVSSGREIARFYSNPERRSRAAVLSCIACSPDGRLLAAAEKHSGTIRLLEIASGKVRAEFAGHRHGIHGLTFSPDGKTLASGGEDHVAYLWDVTGTRTPSAVKPPPNNDLASLWNDLAFEDGQRAGAAIASLLRRPKAGAAFLREKLHPAQVPSEKRLARLIADLDADAYVQREAASRELILLGEQAEAALRRELTKHPTLEMRRRIEDILAKLDPSSQPPSQTLQTLRAVEVLEHVGTEAARHCLESLAKGAADARLTREAKAALRRVGVSSLFDRKMN